MPSEIRTIGIQPDVMRLTRLTGVGKEADMPLWFENLHLRRHNPITLAVAAEITGDAALAAQTLDIGRAYFELAFANPWRTVAMTAGPTPWQRWRAGIAAKTAQALSPRRCSPSWRRSAWSSLCRAGESRAHHGFGSGQVIITLAHSTAFIYSAHHLRRMPCLA